MAIHYTCTVTDDILFVHASGFDESAEEVVAYGIAVAEACREHSITRVLCDERDLEYRLGIFDTYEAAGLLATTRSSLTRAALVCNSQFAADARLWEHIMHQRDLAVRVFFSIEKAIDWLREDPS